MRTRDGDEIVFCQGCASEFAGSDRSRERLQPLPHRSRRATAPWSSPVSGGLECGNGSMFPNEYRTTPVLHVGQMRTSRTLLASHAWATIPSRASPLGAPRHVGIVHHVFDNSKRGEIASPSPVTRAQLSGRCACKPAWPSTRRGLVPLRWAQETGRMHTAETGPKVELQTGDFGFLISWGPWRW